MQDRALADTQVWTNVSNESLNDRSVGKAMGRGALGKCPACGARTLFTSYLKVVDTCPSCGLALHHHRADDAPPYFTIFAVGHIVIPLLMTVELLYGPPLWLHLLIWLPMVVVLSLLFLPRIKGAIVGLQWALKMHGFGEADAHADPAP
jgi:uncharacterized protein (DUF983 family)